MEEKKLEVVLKGSIDTNSAGVQDIRIDVSDVLNFFVEREELKQKKEEEKLQKQSLTKPGKSGTSEIIAVGSQDEIEKLINNNIEKEEVEEKEIFDYSKFSYSGNLQDEPFKEILAFQDGKVYLSYDGFAYFFIMCLVGIFIFRMFIKLCILSFNLGFNYFIPGKK